MTKKKALAPSPVTTRDKKGRKFMSIVGDAYDKANLTEDEAQCVNEASGLADLVGKFIAANRHVNLLTRSEQMAASILGSNEVVGYRDVMNTWSITMPEVEPIMPFSEEILKQCAEENKKGADWRLVYVNGFSLRKQEEIRGRNRKNQPCFDPDYIWWLEPQQTSWAIQLVEAGYRLLNFEKNLYSMNWQTQESEIAKLGEKFERAEEQAVVEACLTIFMIKKKRLLKDWYHWGRFQASGSGRVLVGRVAQGGFVVGYSWDDFCDSSLGVVLSRKS